MHRIRTAKQYAVANARRCSSPHVVRFVAHHPGSVRVNIVLLNRPKKKPRLRLAAFTAGFGGDNPLVVNGLFNCGTGMPRTWVDLANAVFNAMGREPNIEFIDMPQHLRDKYQYYTCAMMDKIRAQNYPAEFHSLEEGIKDYVGNYLTQDA